MSNVSNVQVSASLDGKIQVSASGPLHLLFQPPMTFFSSCPQQAGSLLYSLSLCPSERMYPIILCEPTLLSHNRAVLAFPPPQGLSPLVTSHGYYFKASCLPKWLCLVICCFLITVKVSGI